MENILKEYDTDNECISLIVALIKLSSFLPSGVLQKSEVEDYIYIYIYKDVKWISSWQLRVVTGNATCSLYYFNIKY